MTDSGRSSFRKRNSRPISTREEDKETKRGKIELSDDEEINVVDASDDELCINYLNSSAQKSSPIDPPDDDPPSFSGSLSVDPTGADRRFDDARCEAKNCRKISLGEKPLDLSTNKCSKKSLLEKNAIENRLVNGLTRMMKNSAEILEQCQDDPVEKFCLVKNDPSVGVHAANGTFVEKASLRNDNAGVEKSPPKLFNQFRPSVIKCTDIPSDKEFPDVEEHFRKSLGQQVAFVETEAKVDDHFARALGNLWHSIKRRDSYEDGRSSRSPGTYTPENRLLPDEARIPS